MHPLLTRWARALDDQGLLVVGGASLDTLHVAGTPTPSPGGAGLYTALAAERTGRRVTMLAPRPDPMPASLAPALERITWVGPVVPPEDLPRFELAYDATGDTTLFSAVLGVEPDMRPPLLDLVEPLPAAAYCVPFLDATVQQQFIRALQAAGCLTVAATFGGAVRNQRDTVLETLALADLFFCNHDEAEQLFGSVEAARTGPGQLLFVTLGRRGARVVMGDETVVIGPEAVRAVDPTGAGDTFCGTTVGMLLAGAHPVEAARAGAAAAAQTVGAVGPAALWAPRRAPAVDERARVDPARVQALAGVLAGSPEVAGFDFTGPSFPPVGAAHAVDWFWAATAQQYRFWRHDGTRWTEPVRAVLDGVERKGSDLLWATYARWVSARPDAMTPAGQQAVTAAELARRLATDDASPAFDDLETRAATAVAYGTSLLALDATPTELTALAATTARPLRTLLTLLDRVGGYREDPLRKKAALLAVILRQRPEGWLPTVDGDDAPPIVDYHVQRTCLRTGIVELTDDDLRTRIEQRLLLAPDEEAAVRRAAWHAVADLVAASRQPMGAVDWFLFQMRHRCPETTVPDCGACPADPVCAHRVELFQPVLVTTAY